MTIGIGWAIWAFVVGWLIGGYLQYRSLNEYWIRRIKRGHIPDEENMPYWESKYNDSH